MMGMQLKDIHIHFHIVYTVVSCRSNVNWGAKAGRSGVSLCLEEEASETKHAAHSTAAGNMHQSPRCTTRLGVYQAHLQIVAGRDLLTVGGHRFCAKFVPPREKVNEDVGALRLCSSATAQLINPHCKRHVCSLDCCIGSALLCLGNTQLYVRSTQKRLRCKPSILYLVPPHNILLVCVAAPLFHSVQRGLCFHNGGTIIRDISRRGQESVVNQQAGCCSLDMGSRTVDGLTQTQQ